MFTIETKMAKHQSSQKTQPNGPTESSKKLDAINLAMEQIKNNMEEVLLCDLEKGSKV